MTTIQRSFYRPSWSGGISWATTVCLLAFLLLTHQQAYAQLAKGKDKFLGNIIGFSVPSNFDNYWNQITMENLGKWESVEPNRNQFSWNTNPNNVLVQAYNKAINNGYPFKAHTFIWANQIPGWLPGLSEGEQRGAVDNMMDAYFRRFPQTATVDVVNEALDLHAPAYGTHANGSQGWMKFNGNSDIGKWSWVKWAFERAKAARDSNGSSAKLLINDYGILENESATQDYVNLVNAVNANGQLIEGIGVQGHFAYNQNGCGSYTLDTAKVKRNLDRLATTGLPVYVSEFDLNIGNDDEHDSKFMSLFRVFWEHPAVVEVTLWGYIRNETWLPCSWLVDGGTERKTVQSLREYLQSDDNDPLTIPGTLQAEDYSSQSGVQREDTTDIDGGQNIGYIENGDYIELSVNVESAGKYKVDARVASETAGGSIDLLVNNQTYIGNLDVSTTGGWQNWSTVSENVELNAGEQTLRLNFKGAGGYLFNVNWLRFTKTDGSDVTLAPIDLTVDESDGIASVAVQLSAPSSQVVSVTAFTRQGSAVGGSDYYGDTKTLTFAAGETEQQFSFTVLNDQLTEPDESLSVLLVDAINATIEDDSATVRIVDDDADRVLLSVADVTVDENAGTARVVVQLNQTSAQPVSVIIFTQSLSAVPGQDYYGKTERLTFEPGQTTRNFNVPILDDSASENTETISVRLANAVGATIDTDRAVIAINDND